MGIDHKYTNIHILFLKILNKEISQDSGIIKFGTNVKIGYFDQNIDKLNSDKTVLVCHH
mgnify:CR=1 FL=1